MQEVFLFPPSSGMTAEQNYVGATSWSGSTCYIAHYFVYKQYFHIALYCAVFSSCFLFYRQLFKLLCVICTMIKCLGSLGCFLCSLVCSQSLCGDDSSCKVYSKRDHLSALFRITIWHLAFLMNVMNCWSAWPI